VSIRDADPSELDKPSATKHETGKALRAWWTRWETLLSVQRDRPAAEVIAEERQRD
jgi:hypothetical protein